MKFKVDENLPSECVSFLGDAGFEANTVADENLSGADDLVLFERCRVEGRVLMTLDLDFANVQAYPRNPTRELWSFGRSSKIFQDKPTLIVILQRLISTSTRRSPDGQLWIVQHDRIRYRED